MARYRSFTSMKLYTHPLHVLTTPTDIYIYYKCLIERFKNTWNRDNRKNKSGIIQNIKKRKVVLGAREILD